MLLLVINILFQSFTSVYLVKNNLHTGIVFEVTPEIAEFIPAAEYFKNYKFIDIGWGDEDFYQHPDPDYLLGAKALLVPTSSVVRIEGMNYTIDDIKNRSDFCIRFDLNREQLIKFCKFINSSFSKDTNDNFLITSLENKNRIMFFRSDLKYFLFYTCNTWVAEAFENCGYDISSSEVITAENLFEEIYEFGTVLK